MRSLMLAASLAGAAAPAASASGYGEFPAPVPYPFQRSVLTGRLVTIPPYGQPFAVRIYTTPPRQPLYNVPPYTVIVPY